MQSNNNSLKPFDNPDEFGNIFDPAYRVAVQSPYERVFNYKEIKIGNVPGMDVTTMKSRVSDGCQGMEMHFTKDVSPLMNDEVRDILIKMRYTKNSLEETTRWSHTPKEYLYKTYKNPTLEQVKEYLEKKEYPADVGLHFKYQEVVQKYMNNEHVLDDPDAIGFLIYWIAVISRVHYYNEVPCSTYDDMVDNDLHAVSILDVVDNIMNSVSDIDYLALFFTSDNLMKFVYRVMVELGYTDYCSNPFINFGGSFRGKTEFTDVDPAILEQPDLTEEQFARVMDIQVRHDFEQADAQKAAGQGE